MMLCKDGCTVESEIILNKTCGENRDLCSYTYSQSSDLIISPIIEMLQHVNMKARTREYLGKSLKG